MKLVTVHESKLTRTSRLFLKLYNKQLHHFFFDSTVVSSLECRYVQGVGITFQNTIDIVCSVMERF